MKRAGEPVQWSPAAIPPAAAVLRQAGYSRWLAELLARRGVADPEAAETFLHPALDQLHDPRLLSGVEAAVERLLAARDRGEMVAVVGDYDVDGVSGTALLTAVLRACKVEVRPILPHRLHDGYGFQPVHVERARALGCRLVITVDCGTGALPAARAALEAGLDVVVTDHHLPGQELPPEIIHINPRQAGCDYPFAELSGAGLALKLALAFAAACQREVDPRILLRVASLGTIADLVPLRGENRVIAAIGLRELVRTRSPGLRALIRSAGLRPPYSTADVGFRLGPRLNAPGRLDTADVALELLLSRDPRRAAQLAGELERWNRERQECEKRVTEEARELFLDRSPRPAILVAGSSGWHRGVVGIAAGRLARELNRPTILLAVEGPAATGSGRSIAGIHLFRFLSQWEGEMVRFGGHAQAIGLTVREERREELQARWEQEAANRWRDRVGIRRLEYELELEAQDVTAALLAELARLEPHGEGNPQPLVRLRGPLRLVRAPRFFGAGHLEAEAASGDGGRIGLLGWGWRERSASLEGEFEVLGHLDNDSYRGRPVLRLVGARPHSQRAGKEA